MNLISNLRAHLNLSAVCCLTLVLTACGGGGGSSSAVSADPAQVNDVVISGSVGDGPIVGSTISIYTSKGDFVKTLRSDNTAKYNVRISKKVTDYPLTIVATGGVDLVTGRAPDFNLESVILSKDALNVNLNPYTTLMTDIARQLPGGLQNSNIQAAKQIVMSKMNFGLDTSQVSDPMTTDMTKHNVAVIIKASETLSEMIRRTRDGISSSGTTMTGDDVIHAMASDLTDGSLDGNGVAGTNRRVSALANITTGQVAIEAMSNNMRVYGLPSATAMDAAILTVKSRTSDSLLSSSVTVNSEIIDQASGAVAAANAISPNANLAAILQTLGTLTVGSGPQDVAALLSADHSLYLDQAVTDVMAANDQQLDVVNNVANAPFNPASTNTAPTLTGTPSTSVLAGSAYTFTPSASDVNGNSLTFSITNAPTWATFNTSTGELSGTPSNSDAGTTSGIVITVSDGVVSTSLPAFNLTVTAITPVYQPPVVSNTPATSVNAGSAYSYTPAATDPGGYTMSFSIANRPSWATFSTSTGKLSGTPSNSNVGTTSGIVITVSDGHTSTTVGPFSITVAGVYQPPVVSNTPATAVNAGSAYSYTPAATDPGGYTMSFSIANARAGPRSAPAPAS